MFIFFGLKLSVFTFFQISCRTYEIHRAISKFPKSILNVYFAFSLLICYKELFVTVTRKIRVVYFHIYN